MLSHEDVQAAISARLDGEDYELADDVIDAHLAGCEECAEFQRQAAALHSTLRGESLRSGMAPPQDLADVILAGVEPTWRSVAAARKTQLVLARGALVLVGIIFFAWAVTLIVVASQPTHWWEGGDVLAPMMMENAAVRFGLAFGLFFAAWRPASAPGMLPVVTTMLMFLVGATMRDVALGQMIYAQLYMLLGLLSAVAALAWTWAADRGFAARSLWRQLSADPV